MKYFLDYFGTNNVIVSIFNRDGSVSISHGGIEMGQGVNTKVAQTAAYILGIPLEKISVKPTNNLVSANGIMSGGSIASESNCFVCKFNLIKKFFIFISIFSGYQKCMRSSIKKIRTI
jgi:xanthine dehydrogenase/oxidase